MSLSISNFSVDDIPIRLRKKVHPSGFYTLKKYIGIFIPSDRLEELNDILSLHSFIKTKKIIITSADVEHKYTMIYHLLTDHNASVLISMKNKLLMDSICVETADSVDELSDLIRYSDRI